MIKIKVNLDNDLYELLIRDMINFNIIKNDGSVNKNKFMNLLFEHFNKEFIVNKTTYLDSIKRLTKDYDEIISLFKEANNIKGDCNKNITFYLNDDNEFNLDEELINILGTSGYIRLLIYDYSIKPQYLRENIIYKDIVDHINKAILKKKKIKVKLNNNTRIISPYIISKSNEGIFSYLLGKADGIHISINIYKISRVLLLKEDIVFTEEEVNHFNDIIRLGVAFPFERICHAAVRLTKQGVKLYKSKYSNRPIPSKIEDGIYYFDCAFTQLYFYFYSFGKEAEILEPSSLKKQIFNHYKNSLDTFINIYKYNK